MWIDKLALVLLIIGGLNWGLVGVFSFDLVAWLFGGQGAVLSRIVYILVAWSRCPQRGAFRCCSGIRLRLNRREFRTQLLRRY